MFPTNVISLKNLETTDLFLEFCKEKHQIVDIREDRGPSYIYAIFFKKINIICTNNLH